MAKQAWRIMEHHGWRTAALVVHGHHMPRVQAVCQRLGISTVALPGLEKIRFCPDSAQRWTKNRQAWFRREVLAIFYYRWQGWI